jgi:hypothetical protein
MTKNLLVKEKIKKEERRRIQVYNQLDYLLCSSTFFHFFSLDAFTIIKYSKVLALGFKKREVTSDFLLLTIVQAMTKSSIYLKELQFNVNLIIQNCYPKNETIIDHIFSIKDKLNLYQMKFTAFLFNEEFEDTEYISYSNDAKMVLTNAIENAVVRFKTPIITTDILFLTLMENNSLKSSQIIKNLIPKKMDWYLFRYKLIKSIHSQESNVRSDSPKNQRYFGYLLKTQITESQFDNLITNEKLSEAIFLFRDCIISRIIKTDFFPNFLQNILQSIPFTNIRTYSS